MEDFDQELLYEMIINEIAGLLSEEEQACLDRIIAENPEAYKFWKDLHEAESAHILASSELHKDDPMEVVRKYEKALQGGYPPRKRKAVFIKPVSITVLSVLLVMTALYTINQRRTRAPDSQPAQAIATNEDPRTIILTLPDGQRLDLSIDTANTQVDNVVFINRGNRLRFRGKGSPGIATLYVPAGKDYTVVLADKTTIKLSPNSVLRFPINFTGETRSVFLRGKAFLQVAPNNNQPFVVVLPKHHKLQVLGTAFNVNTHKGAIKVSLITGSLKMETLTDSLRLKPGYEVVSVNGEPLEADRMDPAELVYEFREQSLQEVAKVIARWYNIEVVLSNNKVSNMQLTGKIDRQKPLHIILNQLGAINFHHELNAACDTLRFW
ncbi:FecR family protein [Chitinophaga agrisoli]|uniref:FecR family protein n=1 Tax=Chitinophaga agrisoli TaxID=2607653 RepID=A0A5B2VJI5_9BACT|nr:FecR domain-containing protein [Chitinophaga agrisoli]KAA2239743.1 FecR family protein [Chitinophaga agrisoli]